MNTIDGHAAGAGRNINGTISSPDREEVFSLDELGNWTDYLTKTTGGGTDFEHTREHNPANETGTIVGPTDHRSMAILPPPPKNRPTKRARHSAGSGHSPVSVIQSFEFDSSFVIRISSFGCGDFPLSLNSPPLR